MRHLYREGLDRRWLASMRLLAVSSLYGNPATDIKSGNEFVRDAVRSVAGCVPYMSYGESLEEERERAVREYERMMEKFARMSENGQDGA